MASQTIGKRVWEMMPGVMQQRDTSGDLEAFCDVLDQVYELLEIDTILKIRANNSLETAPASRLPYHAAERGLRLPPVVVPGLRNFLSALPQFQRWKGNYDLLAAAIFVATKIPVIITIPWHDSEDGFLVGTSLITDGEINANYRPEALDSFAVGGEGIVGYSFIGSDAINPTYPYQFVLDFPVLPSLDLKTVIEWVVEVFKRAVDIPVYNYPSIDDTWQIGFDMVGISTMVLLSGPFEVGTSLVGGSSYIIRDLGPIERIILPDDSTTAEE